MKKPLITLQQNTAVSWRTPIFLTAARGSLEEHDSWLPHNTSELLLFIINYALYFFHRHKKETGMEISCSSTLYYYFVYKEAVSGESQGRSQAVTGSISCSQRAAGALLWRCTRCTFCGFLLGTAERCPWPPQPWPNTWPAGEISSTEGKAKQDGNTSMLRTAPAWGHSSEWEPTLSSVLSKIQLRVRDLHFAPTQKQLLKS